MNSNTRLRKIRIVSNLHAVCLGALLFTSGGQPAGAAVTFDSFGTPPLNETTFSIGVYRLVVDTNNTWWTMLSGYPGFFTNGDAVTLTSPACYDQSTEIGRGEAYPWNNVNLTSGEPVGINSSTIVKSSDYAAAPAFFSPAGNTRKLFTELRSLVLVGTIVDQSHSNCPPCTPPPKFQSPPPPLYTGPLIWAGAEQISSPDRLPISRGQVQSSSSSGLPANDFSPNPARSFFDVYAEVCVPALGSWLAVAYLTNSDPLVVINSDITTFPPSVVYVHEETAAVPVYFANTSPYWSAGQRFGWMILAGHGVLSNNVVCPDCTVVEKVCTNSFGVNNDKPGLPLAVDSFYGPDLCPPALATFASPANAITNKFAGASGLLLRRIRHSNLPDPIPLPAPGASATYTASSTQIEFDTSANGGTNWNHITAPASVSISITGTTDSGPPRVFRTEMTQLSISGGTLPAGTMVRESPSKASVGRTTQRLIDGGYRISSFFDVFLEISLDSGNSWWPADSATRIVLAQPVSYTVVLQPGYNLIANNLKQTNFNVNTVIPTAPEGAELFKWDNIHGAFGGMDTFDSLSGGWVNEFWELSTNTLATGEIAMMSNPNISGYPITFTGRPNEPVLPMPLQTSHIYGYGMQTASQGTYDSITGRLPAEGSQLMKWDLNIQDYTFYTYHAGVWGPANPTVAIGEGVFIAGPSSGTACLTITCPDDILVTSPDGFPVNVPFSVTVSNYCGSGPVVLSCSTPSPGPFPVGTTTVNCVATNDASTVSCSFKVIVAPPAPVAISISFSNNQIIMTWPGSCTLQAADKVTGPFVDIDPTPASPYVITPSALVKQQYYRLRCGPPSFTFYDTEMLQLDISGGNLPAGMMLRESPTLASTGKTAIQPQTGGQYVISSFFDVYTEVSTDNGFTWYPSTSLPPHMSVVGTFQSETLPPTNSTYVSKEDWHALYASGIEVTNVEHLLFLDSFPPPPPGGIVATHTFSSTAHMVVRTCPTCPFTVVTAPATATVKIKSR
jgi:hypothetical protein